MTTSNKLAGVTIRRLEERDLPEADRILRQAFGTFLGLPDPMDFMGDGDFVRTRWAADPSAALAAEVDGELVGTNFVTRWGSVGFFGPLTVAPSVWNRGVARSLLDATMAVFDGWGVRHRGLYTFGHSPKHIVLYQSYGFWPRFLTPVLSKPPSPPGSDWTAFSAYIDFLVQTRSIVEYTQVWWSVRPHLTFGTVEVRICDAQPTAEESEGLAALMVPFAFAPAAEAPALAPPSDPGPAPAAPPAACAGRPGGDAPGRRAWRTRSRAPRVPRAPIRGGAGNARRVARAAKATRPGRSGTGAMRRSTGRHDRWDGQPPRVRIAYLLGAIGTTGSGIWLMRLISCTH